MWRTTGLDLLSAFYFNNVKQISIKIKQIKNHSVIELSKVEIKYLRC